MAKLAMSPNQDLFGFWKVADKKFHNKLAATVYAVEHGWWPHFDFNESVFANFDWLKSPKQSLSELYRARAHSLRSQFQRVYLEFSGGADSWNMLYTFLINGIKVDGVIYRHDRNSSQDINDRSAANCAAEGKFSAYPWYKKFQELAPDLKWITHEITDDMIAAWSSHVMDPLQYNMLHPGYITKVTGVFAPSPMKFKDRTSSVLIAGVDKPNIFYDNGNFYLYFPDYAVLTRAVIEKASLDLGHQDRLFYWDPECCDLLAQQAHMVVDWFKRHPDMLFVINNRKNRRSDLYHQIVNRIIYPEYQEIWQTAKASGHYLYSHETWFDTSLTGTRPWNNWQTSCRTSNDIIAQTVYGTAFESLIDSDNGFSRLPASWSRLYKIA